jgi:glycerol-3-phosphate O-acyltransferase
MPNQTSLFPDEPTGQPGDGRTADPNAAAKPAEPVTGVPGASATVAEPAAPDPAQVELPMPAPSAAPAQFAADPRQPAPRRPLWAKLLGWLMEPWVELKIEPGSPVEHLAALDGRPVCYVLEDYGMSNALILERACREAGLPAPLQPLPGDPLGRKRAYLALSRRNVSALAPLADTITETITGTPTATPPSAKTHSGSLARLLESHRARPELDVQLVPVSIFVGSSDARRTRAAAGSRCCSRRTGRWSAGSAACSRSRSMAATPWCSSRRRCRCAG